MREDLASYPGLPSQLCHCCERSCEGRPGYEAREDLYRHSQDRLFLYIVTPAIPMVGVQNVNAEVSSFQE